MANKNIIAPLNYKFDKHSPHPLLRYSLNRPLNTANLPPLTQNNLLLTNVPGNNQADIGSCHDPKTEVLTNHGWKLFSNVKEDIDLLATVNPKTSELFYEKPTRVVEIDYKGLLYCADTENKNFKVTANHNMLVRKFNHGKRRLNDYYEFITAEKLGWYCGLLNRVVYNGTENKSDTYTFEEFIHHNRLSYSKEKLTISMKLWMQLLGIFIAEGTLFYSTSKKSTVDPSRIQIAAFKEREKTYIRNLLTKLNLNFQEHVDRFTFSHRQIWLELAKWFYKKRAPYKFVPEFVFAQTKENIKYFLLGHFMGDGCEQIMKFGTCTQSHYTSSWKLAEDLQTLIFLSGNESYLGIRPPRSNTKQDGRTITGRFPEHRISVRQNSNLSLSMKEDIFTEYYEGKVYCAEVPTHHTLVTRRENKILISGNCTANSLDIHLRYLSAKQGKLHNPYARLFIYWNERNTDGDVNTDGGSTITTGITVLKRFGAPDERIWPYDKSNLYKKPSIRCYNAAQKALVTEAFQCVSKEEILQCLADGYVLSFGMMCFSNIDGDEVAQYGYLRTPQPNQQPSGGHALCAIDYGTVKDFMDAADIQSIGIDATEQVLLIANSWGNEWGLRRPHLRGYFILPFSYAFDINLCSDFWTMRNQIGNV